MRENEHHDHGAQSEPSSKSSHNHQEIAGILGILAAAACVLGYMLSSDPGRRHWQIAAYLAAWVLFGLALAVLLWEPKKLSSSSPESRPYLWIKSVKPSFEQPQDGTVVAIVVENSGDAVAVNATCRSRIITADKPITSESDVPKDIILPPKTSAPTSIPPKGSMMQTLPDPGERVNENFIPNIKDGKAVAYLFGEIRYQEMPPGKKSYFRKFCYVYDVNRRTFYVESFHNEEGELGE